MNSKLTPFEHHFSKIAIQFGEKSRALMLWHLSDGRPYTASELAFCVDISAQSASNHLSQLKKMNIIKVEKSGRYKYYKIANPQVAMVLENMANLIPDDYDKSSARKLENEGTKFARTCYDHLAGKLGIDITSAMIDKGIVRKNRDIFVITKQGEIWFSKHGININALKNKKRTLAHKCLDWTEKKYHIGGALGSAFLEMMFKNDWIRRKPHSRQVLITARGKSELLHLLEINL
ncbi:helix-turn-helix domain-containing protein [uncultured Psychroserpens sp.]|uniref:ArsR/SmtB family transcription factor n=1 Tax=uncultured Psychroserpens sp. TaxID=255436 RepID=UPI0026068A41|nr:helix-turn-helix domain-containing protein [uncultured Psychroserpens sp.]